MELTLGLKDIIYISVYVVSIASLVFTFRNRLKNVEDKMRTHNSTLFKKDASLNLITTGACKDHRDKSDRSCKEYRQTVDRALDKGALVTKEILTKLERLNINIVKIAAHMEVDVDE